MPTFVLGFLAKPDASDEELAQCAGLCGVEVTPQAVEQRFTPRLVDFLEGLFRRAVRCVIGANAALAPLLERFNGVFWLSRLQFGTSVFSTLAAPLRLLAWLAEQAGAVVDQPILLGAERKLACRLGVGVRCPGSACAAPAFSGRRRSQP